MAVKYTTQIFNFVNGFLNILELYLVFCFIFHDINAIQILLTSSTLTIMTLYMISIEKC